VQEAFRRASAEALRNVAQHSGVKSADVTVGMRGLVVGVQIRDRGVGFEPGVTHRRGLSASIQARMTDVGGSASVTSAPGEGTVVDLTWSPWPRRAAWTEGKAGILPDLFPYLVVMAAPLLLLGLWFPPLLDRHLARSGPTAFGSVLVGLVGIAYLLRGLRHRTSGMFTAALVVLSWTAVGINAWALPGGSAHARLFWMPGVVSGAVALVTIYRRSIEGAIMALGVVVIAWIGSSARVPDGADWLPYLAPTATPILCLLVTLVVRWVGERLGWEVLRLSEESEADTNAPPLEATLAQRLSGARAARSAAQTGSSGSGRRSPDPRDRDRIGSGDPGAADAGRRSSPYRRNRQGSRGRLDRAPAGRRRTAASGCAVAHLLVRSPGPQGDRSTESG